MVRHHHQDSSQLSLALFGGGGTAGVPTKTPGQMRNSTSQIDEIARQPQYDTMTIQERRQKEWEANSMSLAGGFWGQKETNTPPTDKPPDKNRKLSAYHHPFDKPTTQSSQYQPYQQQMSQLQVPQQQMQLQQYQGPTSEMQQYQQTPMVQHVPYQQGFFTSESLRSAQSPMSPNPMYPYTVPMGMPNVGYSNGAPVYYVMAPPNGMPPQLLPDMLKHIPANAPQNSQQLILESISSASSIGSRWSPSPDHQKSIANKALARAKWGEKGVGVGHLWDPEVSVNIPASTASAGSVPPNWAETNESTMHAGGHTPGERTHTRGQAVVLDAQERAERQRKQRQAQETQRIIQQQLDEKKRQQEEEIERDKKEAAMWEQKLKEQREKERKEIEEEQKKKRDKEEAEERRQIKLREAIEEAALKAKREKEESRFGRNKLSTSQIETTRSETAISRSVSDTAVNKKEYESDPPAKRELVNAEKTEKEEPIERPNEKTIEEKEKEILSKINMPDLVSSSQLGTLDQSQKFAILRALGIAPELFFSSCAMDKSNFVSLVGQSFANNVPIIKEDGGEYIRNVVLTPTKFRRARDCGIQCDDVLSDGEENRGSRRRTSRRNKSKSSHRDSSLSPEKKPQWGRHKSERPYKKQSEKDPYSSRKIRRRPMRSVSISGRDNGSNTEESESHHANEPRRRRKTWDESRQESLSSDFSRSPSPRSRKGSKISFRGQPPIKPPLTPIASLGSSCNQDKLSDSSMYSFKISPSANSAFTLYKGREDEGDGEKRNEEDEETKENKEINKEKESGKNDADEYASQAHDDDADVAFGTTTTTTTTTTTATFRTDSPPVPALKGGSSFDIPEYPPGVDPEEIINRPIRRRSSKPNAKEKKQHRRVTKIDPNLGSIPDPDFVIKPISGNFDDSILYSNSSHSFDQSFVNNNNNNNNINNNNNGDVERSSTRAAPERKQRKASLPVIYTPDEAEFFDIPPVEENVKPRKKHMERRSSLTSGPRTTEGEQSPKVNSVTRPSSKTSHTATPRRLPPLPYSPSQVCRDRPGSPPVPAIQQRMLECSLNGRSIETLSLSESCRNFEKITPVEEVTPRIRTGMSKVPSSSSPTSISTGNDSSTEMSLKVGRRRKKESADSGVSELMSRPSSTSSLIEEQLGTGMNSLQASISSSYRRPRDLTISPTDDPEQWVVLKSLSSIRQNFWRKTQDLSLNAGPENGY